MAGSRCGRALALSDAKEKGTESRRKVDLISLIRWFDRQSMKEGEGVRRIVAESLPAQIEQVEVMRRDEQPRNSGCCQDESYRREDIG